VEDALNAMDSPSMDGVNTFVISKAIRNSGIKVAMSGIGGDELFAGYPTFLQYYKLRKGKIGYAGMLPLRKLAAAIIEQRKSNRSKRLASLLNLTDTSIYNVYPILRSILTPSFINNFTNLDVHASNLQSILKHDMKYANRLGLFSQYSIAEYLGYTQNTLLKDADQMSMAVGLEIREPFFDHELIEFVLSLRDGIKFPMYPKQLMVESLEPLLPKEIVHRPKQGFLLPWEKWMRKELSSFCEKQLIALSERNIINKKELMSYWQRFLKHDPSVRWSELWLFVVLGYWMERNGVE
jgi:asparagine synthase (glutamine-hydrolysing)